MSIHVRNIEDFKKLLGEAGNKLVIVDFFAHWCGPCKMIAPKLEELAHEYPEKIIIVKVDVDECEDLAAEYNIASMPTFVYIIASNKLETFTGANYEKVKTLALKYI